jgi:hypothetical protein
MAELDALQLHPKEGDTWLSRRNPAYSPKFGAVPAGKVTDLRGLTR